MREVFHKTAFDIFQHAIDDTKESEVAMKTKEVEEVLA